MAPSTSIFPASAATISTQISEEPLFLGGCGRKVNKVELQLENDFAGLVVIRATPDSSTPFSGRVVIPKHGELNVSEKEFYGEFRINAARLDGTRLNVRWLSDHATSGTYALWGLPDGAFIRYFFLGNRDEMEQFYQQNKDRLYRVEESRLKRTESGFELKVADPNANSANDSNNDRP
jgi:hypothetical protein